MTESGDARKTIAANGRDVWHRHCVDACAVALLVTIGLILPPHIAPATMFAPMAVSPIPNALRARPDNAPRTYATPRWFASSLTIDNGASLEYGRPYQLGVLDPTDNQRSRRLCP